jgi:hypothetical protein
MSGIDLRVVKCACGSSTCSTGISFDSDDNIDMRLLRFHFLDKEVHMVLTKAERKELIKWLK